MLVEILIIAGFILAAWFATRDMLGDEPESEEEAVGSGDELRGGRPV